MFPSTADPRQIFSVAKRAPSQGRRPTLWRTPFRSDQITVFRRWFPVCFGNRIPTNLVGNNTPPSAQHRSSSIVVQVSSFYAAHPNVVMALDRRREMCCSAIVIAAVPIIRW